MGRSKNKNRFKKEKMIYTFSFSDDAIKDIQQAYDWYEEQREGLGNQFIDTIEKGRTSIQFNPLLYGFRKKNIRGYITKDFPFVILYYVKGNNIRVTAVFHMSKK